MDERSLKRLVITLVVAIGIILLAKFLLTRTYTNLNKVAAAKRQAAAQQQAASAPASPTLAVEFVEPSPANEVPAAATASAAVAEDSVR